MQLTKTNKISRVIYNRLIFTIILGIGFFFANAQVEESSGVQRLAGPRLGVTFLTSGSSADFVNDGSDIWDDDYENGKSGTAFISQYGWQLESRFADGGTMTGIVEWVFLIGGMEHGKFLPSTSSLIGVRTSNGFEFAAGPNLSLSAIGMVFTAGYNFTSGKLNLPVNFAFVPGKPGSWGNSNHTGARFSIMLGFNIQK